MGRVSYKMERPKNIQYVDQYCQHVQRYTHTHFIHIDEGKCEEHKQNNTYPEWPREIAIFLHF